MRILIFLSRLVCFVSLFLSTIPAFSQKKIYGRQAYMMAKVLDKFHYQPININDQLSEQLFKYFMKDIDPNGAYFTKEDVAKLADWKLKLDDEINSQSSEFIEKVAALYKEKLLLADTTMAVLLNKPMDFNAPDSLKFVSEESTEVNYAADDAALKKRWNRRLKYQVLSVMFAAESADQDLFNVDVKTIMQKEPEARKKVLARNKRTIKKKLNAPGGFENSIASKFLNSLAYCYDPHTEFFSPDDKEDFQESLSAEEYALGLYLDENDKGEVMIAHLVPGGAAWKSNQLHKGDVLLKIKHSNAEVDVVDATVDEAEDIIGAITSKEVELTIRNASGQVKQVELVKTKLRSDENVVKSFILEDEGKKIGYISLPSFYTDWDNVTQLGCANDVAKEIVKLQEENIEGLIMDLRYNGGGSVEEAIGLAGIFIDEGPLCIHRSREAKPRLLKDMNRGTAYDGPLLVMVNGLSASASEIFSAAMQDYHRAVIAGSNTFGKATGQIIVPIDTSMTMEKLAAGAYLEKENKLGFVKVTTEKYYRVTNSTCQKLGVQTDVSMPYPFMYDEYRESNFETCLPRDTVIKKAICNILPALPLQELNAKSVARVKTNKKFTRLKEVNDSLLSIEKQQKPIPLNVQQFKKSEKVRYQLINDLDNVMTDSTQSMKVVTNKYDRKVDEMDSESRETNEILVKNIRTDIYIQESYRVMVDLINFGKK